MYFMRDLNAVNPHAWTTPVLILLSREFPHGRIFRGVNVTHASYFLEALRPQINMTSVTA
jgi:hypothetical protein